MKLRFDARGRLPPGIHRGLGSEEVAASPRKDLHPALRKAEADALRSQLNDLRKEIEEYNALRSGRRKTVALASLDELPKTLIRARIAAGLTQEELAAKLGLKPQQIQVSKVCLNVELARLSAA